MKEAHREPERFPWIPVLSLAAVALAFLALSVQKIWNVDLWWQLRTGQWILESVSIPRDDFLSFTAVNYEWIELRWIFCAVAYGLWKLGGSPLLILAQTVAVAAAFTTLVWSSRRVVTDLPAVALLALAVVAASDRFVVRPELVSFVLIAVFIVILEGLVAGRYRRAVWLLPALQVLWVNSHTLFVFGPVIAWSFAAGALVRRRPAHEAADDEAPSASRVALVAAAVTGACWINPYFHRGATLPFVLLGEIRGGVLSDWIQEFVGPFELAVWPWYVWATAALAIVSAASFLVARFNATRLLLWLLFGYVAMVSVRNVAPFALIAMWVGLRNYESAADTLELPGRARAAFPFVQGVLAVVMLLFSWYVVTDRYAVAMNSPRQFGIGVVDSNTPRDAAAFLAWSKPSPQIYNDLIDGSYLIWAVGEDYPVFVDGRLEVYGEELLARLLAIPRRRWQSSAEWDAEADRLGINTVVLNRQYHNTLMTQLNRAFDWVLVYLDARNVIFVRRIPENKPVIDRYRIDPTDPWTPRGPEEDIMPTGWRAWLGAVGRPTHSFEMAKTFLALSSVDNAVTYLERGLERFPDHREMRWTLAQVQRSLGREETAVNLMKDIRLSRDEEFRAARLLGHLLFMDERTQEAIEPFERAVELRPEDPAALIDLGKAALAAEDYRLAADAYDRVVRLRPNVPTLWVNLGLALQRSGNRTRAIAAYEQAIAYDPNQFQVLNQVGMLYAEQGDAGRAERYFQRALRIRPDYTAARANLERLRSSR